MKKESINKTDIDYHGFNTFSITMVAIAEFVVMIVLGLQIRELYSEIDHKSKEYTHNDLLTFSMLPPNIKKQYMLKKPEGILEKSIMKDDDGGAIDHRDSYTQYIGNEKIVFVSEVICEGILSGSYELSNACLIKLDEFFSSTNENMIFEVIPLVQSSDLINLGRILSLLETSEFDKYYLNTNMINHFTRYTRDGLAQSRIQQGILQVKKHIGKNAKIKLSPFHKFSNKQSGLIVRAYNVL